MKRRFVYVFATAGIALLALTYAQLQFPFSQALPVKFFRPPATAPMAQEFRLEEVASIAEISPANLKPDTIAFSDHRNDPITDAKSGLIRFVDWARANPLQRQLLSLYPSYDEPTITATVGGTTKTMTRRLHIYVAEARFELARAPNAIDLTRYVNLPFLDRMDPSIKHHLISADEVMPNKDGRLANKHPARRWCEDAATVICIKSRYQLEGKLPTAILLLNKLRESGKQIADFIEFESELRIIPSTAIDQAAFAQLTGIDTPVTAVLEQNIVHVNQVMQFGKFLAVLQEKPADPSHTVTTAFVTLAVEFGSVRKAQGIREPSRAAKHGAGADFVRQQLIQYWELDQCRPAQLCAQPDQGDGDDPEPRIAVNAEFHLTDGAPLCQIDPTKVTSSSLTKEWASHASCAAPCRHRPGRGRRPNGDRRPASRRKDALASLLAKSTKMRSLTTCLPA